MSRKHIDYIISILTALFGVLVLQLIFFPLLSRQIDNVSFGEVVLIFAIVNVCSLVFGNTLNNIRLINFQKYNLEDNQSYKSLLIIILGFNNIILSIILMILNLDILSLVIILIWSTFMLLRSYLIVEFRISLDFLKILISVVINSMTLLVLLIPTTIYEWNIYIPFMLSEILTYIFLRYTTTIMKEKVTWKVSKKVKIDYIQLFFSNLLNNLINYIDRFAIGVILGKKYIAIFFAATVLGKFSTLIIQPISSVILSYNAKNKSRISKKDFKKLLIINLFVSFFLSIVIYIISKPIVKFIYPKLANESMDILFLANLGVILLAVSTIAQSYILSYGKLENQIKLNVVFLTVFIVSIFPLCNYFGLIGFSVSLIISAFAKYISIWLIGHKIFEGT